MKKQKKPTRLKKIDAILHILILPLTIFYWIGTLFAWITFSCNTSWKEWDEILLEYQKSTPTKDE